ncbi:MAG: 6-bladed beta-propeller [Gammaproteobacteria bacterium]|nr:MAG: 6-bladed beta-propeller [Gammaproteobacteria bacterium]
MPKLAHLLLYIFELFNILVVPMHKSVPSFSLYICGLLLLSLAGCATTEKGEPPELPVFPSPPDEPRFYYERSFLGSVDVEIESEESVFQRVITGAVRLGTGMGKPFGVSVHQGRVFVSDTVKRTVLAFDVPQARFFEIGTESPGELSKPMGLDVDLQGNLYVCDAALKQVLMYDRDGNYLRRFGEPEWFDRPAGLTVDPSGERVFVVDTGGVASKRHQVNVIDTKSGELLRTISTRGSAEGELNLPRDATIAEDGNLYVVDGGNFRIQVFSQQGEFLRTFGAIGRRSGQFSRPKGIGADKDGNIYIADTAFGNFQIFDAQGRLLLAVGLRSSTPGPATFMLPAGLAVDEDGRIYMVDQYFRKVDVFRPVSLPDDQGWLVYKPETSQ